VRGGVQPHDPEVVLAGVRLGEVAADPLEAALHRVHVRVHEAGEHQAAGQVDLGATGEVQAGQLGLADHGPDPVAVDHDRLPGAVP
jgi:hypothetical protein